MAPGQAMTRSVQTKWHVLRAALSLGATLAACRSANTSDVRPAAGPTPHAASHVASAAEAWVSLTCARDAPDGTGLPDVALLLDDPRLSSASARERAGDDEGAAEEVDRVQATLGLSSDDECAFAFLAGRFHLSGGAASAAADAFGRVAGDGKDGETPCPLATYARLRQAEALVRASRCDAALVAVRSLGEDFAAHDEAALTLADALACSGRRAEAVARWRTMLSDRPHGLRWVDVAVQLADALLDGVDGPPESRAQEAMELATRVIVEAPAAAEKLDAEGLRGRAAKAAGKARPSLSPEDRARQAQAWLDASQPKRAREVAEAVVKSVPRGSKGHAQAACKAAIAFAEATPHGKADDAANAWGSAIGLCDGDDALVTALYQGARASSSAKRPSEALARYELVEKRFPDHRLADDARLRAALVLQDLPGSSDVSRALAMLWSLPDTYPEGDMRSEALFRVSLARIDAGDWLSAKASLDRLLATAPDGVGSSVSGRAEYFRARVAELSGDAEDAKDRYAALVSARPLTYYMLLAYARLRAADDAAARTVLEAAVRKEPAGRFWTREHPEIASAAFGRLIRLLAVGEVEAARREAAAGGLTGEAVDPEVVWTVARLFDRAGSPALGHAFARGRLADYRAHWPAGRWRVAWETAYPAAFETAVLRESEAADIPPPLTWGIMREESAFNPDAKSVVNALGLMQLMGPTARRVARDTPFAADDQALRTPDVSIALGARLLSSLRAGFPMHPALAVLAYNAGGVAVRRWIDRGPKDFDVFVEHIPFDETRNYVKRVLASEAAYAFLYAPAALDEVLGSRILSDVAAGR